MRKFNAVFNDHPELRAVFGQARQLTATQAIWHSIVPAPLNQHCQAGNVQHRRLTVYADNGAVASKIKLMLPNLLVKLQKQGVEVTSIRVEVQVQSHRLTPNKPLRKVSISASEQLKQLADTLPDSDLGRALRKLSSRT